MQLICQRQQEAKVGLVLPGSDPLGKVRNKSHGSELDYLRNENKQLKSENRNLKKQLRSLEKKSHWFESSQYEETDEDVQTDNSLICPECGKGQMVVADFIHIKIHACNLCDYKVKEFKDGRKETITTKTSSYPQTKTSKSVLDRKKTSKRKVKTNGSRGYL